jgi:hypothetical protein
MRRLLRSRTALDNPAWKTREPNVFTLERLQWCFISVYLVQYSKIPIQGAYIARNLFEVEARDLTLLQLKAAYPEARLSPMEDIQYWIEKSKELDEGVYYCNTLSCLFTAPVPPPASRLYTLPHLSGSDSDSDNDDVPVAQLIAAQQCNRKP